MSQCRSVRVTKISTEACEWNINDYYYFVTAAAPPPHPHRRASRERTKLSTAVASPHREFHSAWWFTQPRLSIAFSISNSCGIGRVYLLHKLWRKTHISSHRWFRNGLSGAEPSRSPCHEHAAQSLSLSLSLSLFAIQPRFTIPRVLPMLKHPATRFLRKSRKFLHSPRSLYVIQFRAINFKGKGTRVFVLQPLYRSRLSLLRAGNWFRFDYRAGMYRVFCNFSRFVIPLAGLYLCIFLLL